MEIKKIFWAFFLHLELFILGSLLFILLFHTNLFASVSVFFYRGIFLLVISSILIILIAIVVKTVSKRKIFTVRDVLLSVVVVFCFNLVFFTHVPVTADRSISVFLLGYLNDHPGEIITKDEVAQVFIKKYIYEYEGINKRFEEQIASGNIVDEENGYRITKQGKFIISVYNLIANLFDIDKKIVSP